MDSIDVFALQCHPAAEKFPMLDDDELAELANDISENGLRQPLVIYQNGAGPVLLDGRNRRAACALVKVTPEYVIYEGDDPAGFVLSSNINRRHMTKGQRAMAVAMVHPGGSGHGKNPSNLGLSGERVRQARTVLRYFPDDADAVLSGAKTLDEAYARAQQAKAASESRETVFSDLKSARPDLADQVVEGRLTLEAAIAARRADEETARINRTATFKNLVNLRLLPDELSGDKHIDHVAALLATYPQEFESAAGMTVGQFLAAMGAIGSKGKLLKQRVSER